MDKKSLRSTIVEKRTALVGADLSQRIVQELIKETWLWDFKTVLAYLPFRGEVDIVPLLNWLEQQGKHICLPKVIDKKEGLMEPILMPLPWASNIAPGAFGILEPTCNCIMEPEALDVVLLPGVAFDHECYRLGYGGGFYDRFLPRLSPNALKIGIAFSMQVVERVPREAHDIPLDGICTEHGLKLCREVAPVVISRQPSAASP